MDKIKNCIVCHAPVSLERFKQRGPYCMAKECVKASLKARQTEKPIVLVNLHKQGYQPMFLQDVQNMAGHPKKGQ